MSYGGGRWHALVVGVLACAVAAAYAAALHGAFIFDDLHHLVENQRLHHLSDLGAVLRSGMQETRPVFMLSLAIDYWAHGTEVLGYHVVNLVLHAACASMVYALAVTLRSDLALGTAIGGARPAATLRWFPELAAALFALHPLAAESVAYINSRSGLLAAGFALAGMLWWLRGGRARAVVCMALAMASKESAAVAPLLLVAYRLWFRQGGDARRALRELAPLGPVLATVLVVPLLFVLVKNPHQGTIGAGTLPVVDHLLTQTRVVAFFLRLLAWPMQQNIDYDFQVSRAVGPGVVASLLLLAAVVVLAWRGRRAAPAVWFGTLWFFVALAPTNSVVPFKDFIAERHLYLALVGFALAAGWGAARGLLRLGSGARRLVAAAAVGLLGCLGLLTAARSAVLADPLRLWEETVAASPGKARPHVNLGVLYLARGDQAAGRAQLERAVELDPTDPRASYNLGVVHERRGDLAAALELYRRTVAVLPQPRYRRSLSMAANQLGIDRFRAGDAAAAEPLLREATQADPDLASPHYNLAVVLLAAGRSEEARRELERTLALDPQHQKARDRLASLPPR